MPWRVLFLDIDGVLNCFGDEEQIDAGHDVEQFAGNVGPVSDACRRKMKSPGSFIARRFR
jgi:hypothetical protein